MKKPECRGEEIVGGGLKPAAPIQIEIIRIAAPIQMKALLPAAPAWAATDMDRGMAIWYNCRHER